MPNLSISAGPYAASVRTRGAGLNSLTFNGRDLVDPYIPAPNPENYRGDILAPWPNRIEDGEYTFDGVVYKIPINEPNRNTALHGLVFDLDWEVVDQSQSSVTLNVTLENSYYYPSDLELTTQYSVSDQGLSITISALNVGAKRAPYGVSIHPYLIPTSHSRVDEWKLKVNASQVLEVDLERLLPIGLRSVEDLNFDFRGGRVIGNQFIDHAFKVDLGSELIVSVAADNGDAVEMTFTSDCDWIQIHTADRRGGADSRICLAVEPMTCPPNAFRNPEALRELNGPLLLPRGGFTSSTWNIKGK
jgi:aldose 1-epimerase